MCWCILFWNNLPFVFFRRVPTRSSWRWNWTARSWRAGPSGWRGQWRKKSRRIKQTTAEPQEGPAEAQLRAQQRVLRRVQEEPVREDSSLRRNSPENSKGRPKAPPPSKEKWWIQTKRSKRKDWRRNRSQRRLFISEETFNTNKSVGGLWLKLSFWNNRCVPITDSKQSFLFVRVCCTEMVVFLFFF